jgi:putative endonuclease
LAAGGHLSSVIPVLVTGIQPACVCKPKRLLKNSDQTVHTSAMKGYVYILASKRNGTLYTGVTSDLPGRLYEHQNELTPGFTSRYGVKTLVWFEEYDLVTAAITREKTIKKWPRQWKLNLIEENNPEWDDISWHLMGL